MSDKISNDNFGNGSDSASNENLLKKAAKQSIAIIGNYCVEKTIGQGTYGKVKLGRNMITGEQVAIKVIEKSTIQSNKHVYRMQREIRFLKLLHHPYIVRVDDVFETSDYIYIIMEYAQGGELFEYIVANRRVKDIEARRFFRMIISAVDYCHKNSIIHRDLKPENLLLNDKKEIKIIDFGFGNTYEYNQFLDTFCGSPFYAAPEMILGKKYRGPAVDMWSLGVILYALLCGQLPFDDNCVKALYSKISRGSYSIPNHVSIDAQHLISRLITVDPTKRATMTEVMLHPWVNDGYSLPPFNYLPSRPHITDLTMLDPGILRRLFAFGHKPEEIKEAFLQDSEVTNPIRSTYFLLLEMVQRENVKLEREKLGQIGKKYPWSNSADPLPSSSATATASYFPAKSFNMPPVQPQQESSPQETHTPITSNTTLVSSNNRIAKKTSEDMITEQKQPNCQTRSLPEALNLGKIKPEHEESRTARFAKKWQSSLMSLTGQFKNLPPRFMFRESDSHSQVGMNTASHLSTSSSSSSTPSRLIVPHSTSELSQKPTTPLLTPPHPEDFMGRRSSAPNEGRKGGSGMTLRNDDSEVGIRTMSGWFLNVATTSSKSPKVILNEIERVLTLHQIWYTREDYVIECEYWEKNHEDSSPSIQHQSERKSPVKHFVAFQIEVCKVPKVSLYGLQFKRLAGGVWAYKKVCTALVSEMKL